MKRLIQGMHTLKANRRSGLTMVFALVATALLLGFSLSVLHSGSTMLASANRKITRERCYQQAKSFAQALDFELLYTGSGDSTSDVSTAFTHIMEQLPNVTDELTFKYDAVDHFMDDYNVQVALRVIPTPTKKMQTFYMDVTAKSGGEQYTYSIQYRYWRDSDAVIAAEESRFEHVFTKVEGAA